MNSRCDAVDNDHPPTRAAGVLPVNDRAPNGVPPGVHRPLTVGHGTDGPGGTAGVDVVDQ
jgi:hypothetical protein